MGHRKKCSFIIIIYYYTVFSAPCVGQLNDEIYPGINNMQYRLLP